MDRKWIAVVARLTSGYTCPTLLETRHMNHLEFVHAGLHNRHIVFLCKGKIMSGVVVDDRFHTTNKSKDTHYTFIPTQNLGKWKEAEKRGDRSAMNELSSVLDIEEITWGTLYNNTAGPERLVRDAELQSYIFELLKRRTDLFKNPGLEVRIPGSQYIADIIVEEKEDRQWNKVIVEVKSFSTFTREKLHSAVSQLKSYGQFVPNAKLALAFPGSLPDEENQFLSQNGIMVWDVNFISDTFPDEINHIPHPVLQGLFGKNYSGNTKDKWIIELEGIKTGKKTENEWSRYQKFIQRVLEHLFGPQLSSPIVEHSDHFKINRRDFILRNYAETGFWAHLRTRYYADYIVVDAKNYSKKVTKKEILQIANYLKIHGAGLFGLIFSRNGGDASSYYTCREIWAMDKKLIIVLNDEDLKKMILSKLSSDNPEEIIQQKIEQFRLSM